MGPQITVRKEELYETIRDTDFLTLDDVSVAIDIFKQYSNDNIIRNGSFEDDVWHLTDEYQLISLNFELDELTIKRSPVLKNVEIKSFVNYLKMYVVRLLGDYVIRTIQSFIREVKEVIKTFNGNSLTSKLKLQESNLIYDFLELLDLSNNREYKRLLIVLDLASEKYMYKSVSNKRKLSTFQSYFKFDELLDLFWRDNMSDEKRTFFFPLYLWWKLTSILPLRPREFLLIPRNCFQDMQNPNILTIRRTKLKGGKKKVTYSIKNDYELYRYDVGEIISREIRQYISNTEHYEDNELETLLRTDKHYNYFGKTKRYDSRMFTYANMRYCLRKFFNEVIEKKFNYKVLRSGSKLNPESDFEDDYGLDNQSIEFINLGDTRHIAMINIVASGGTPSTAMMLAGHSSIDMSSHYFSNISTLIECRTYESYKKSINSEKTKYSLSVNLKPSSCTEDFKDLDDGGRCYSIKYFAGDYNDCMKVVSDSGEIGDCHSCTHYRSGKYRIFINDKEIYTQKITDDCEFLSNQLNNYRKGKGYEEDVKKSILKLQNSVKMYEMYFQYKLVNGENNA